MRTVRPVQVGAVWTLSLVGNVTGSILFAAMVRAGGTMSESSSSLLASMTAAKDAATGPQLFRRAVLCNALVCLALWMAARTRSDGAKLAVLWWALLAFICSGFEHSIANATTFALAIFDGSIGWGALGRNLLWTVPGSIVGGGIVIGITADRRADEQIAHFERWGAQVIHGPTIRTEPLVEGTDLRETTRSVIDQRPDIVIANTGLGMRSWIGAAEALGVGDDLIRTLRRTTVIARGAKAVGVLAGYGVDVAARSHNGRLAECVELARPHIGDGTTVVIQLDGGSSMAAVEELRASGATVITVPVYRWHQASELSAPLRLAGAVIAGKVHAVTFTASPAITSWFDIAAHPGVAEDLRRRLAGGDVVIGCVGPVCAEAAHEQGLSSADIVLPEATRLGALVRAVAERLIDKTLRVGDLVITGTVSHWDGRRVDLSDTEARVLALLASAGGAVVPKTHILRDVWGDPGGDPHLVEVAVARLRRRLGDEGDVVVAVPRRGYSLNIS